VTNNILLNTHKKIKTHKNTKMEQIKKHIEQTARGPHQFSNWVVFPDVLEKGRVLMSSYPYRVHVKKTSPDHHPKKNDFYKQIKAFPKGVTYICLQEKKELERLKLPLYYSKKQLTLAKKKTGALFIKYENDLEIPDIDIAQDDNVYKYVDQLHSRYLKGENFIIHCLGGHGRTGTIAGLLLGFILLEKGIILKATELLDVIQYCHTQRVQRNGWYNCPQTNSQCNQVQRLYYRKIDDLGLSVEKEPYLTIKWPTTYSTNYKPSAPSVTEDSSTDIDWSLFGQLIMEDEEEENNESPLSTDSEEDIIEPPTPHVSDDEKEATQNNPRCLTLGDFFSCWPCIPKKKQQKPSEKKSTTQKKSTPSVMLNKQEDEWDIASFWEEKKVSQPKPIIKSTHITSSSINVYKSKKPNQLQFDMSDLI